MQSCNTKWWYSSFRQSQWRRTIHSMYMYRRIYMFVLELIPLCCGGYNGMMIMMMCVCIRWCIFLYVAVIWFLCNFFSSGTEWTKRRWWDYQRNYGESLAGWMLIKRRRSFWIIALILRTVFVGSSGSRLPIQYCHGSSPRRPSMGKQRSFWDEST